MVVQLVKNLPAMQETQVQFLGQEDPLEKEMATHSSILAWEIPWTEKPGRLQSMGLQRVRPDLATTPPVILSWHCLLLCTLLWLQRPPSLYAPLLLTKDVLGC